MKKTCLKIISLLLVLSALSVCFSSCTENDGTLIIGVTGLMGDISPFTKSAQPDRTVKDMLYSKLVCIGSDGSAVYGESENSAALDVNVYAADSSFERKDDGSFTAVEITLKNGMRFSDSTELTADDVVFSIYALTDNATGYMKHEDFPLVGLTDYVTRKSGTEEMIKAAAKAVENGFISDDFTEEEIEALKAQITEAGRAFAEGICDYVTENYLSDSTASAYIIDSMTADEVRESAGLTTAFAMKLWNWGTFIYDYKADPEGTLVGVGSDETGYTYKTTLQKALENEIYVSYVRDENGIYAYDYTTQSYFEDTLNEAYTHYSRVLSDKYTLISKTGLSGFRDTEGTLYTLNGDSDPDCADFFGLMARAYTENGVTDFTALEKTEGTSDSDGFLSEALEAFAVGNGKGDAPDSISGIKTGETEIDGEMYESITLLFDGLLGDAAESCSFYIASREAYLDAFNAEGEVNSVGFPINDASFAQHCEKISASPVGSGPYTLVSSSHVVVELSSNQNFSSMGKELHEPYTDFVKVRDISSQGAVKALSTSYVHAVLSGASAEDGASFKEKVEKYFVPDNSYEYVVVNPAYYLDIRTRQAIISLFDTEQAASSDNCAVITYSIPTFYGFENEEDENAVGSYDPSLTSAWDGFTMSGYTTNEEGILIDPKTGEQASFTFTLMPEEEGGSVHDMFENACALLEKLGAKGEIVFDPDLVYDIYSDSGVAIYALSWTVDGPDAALRERYAHSCDTATLKANGINSLYIGGQIDNYGTVSSGEASLNQSDAVDRLDSLIIGAEKTLDADTRREMKRESLELIRKLSFEIPLYQKGSYALVRSDKIDVSTLNPSPTVFTSLISEIWNVKLTSFASQSTSDITETALE